MDHDLWKIYDKPPKWRIEKKRRVVVMDGTKQILWIKPNYASQGSPRVRYVIWLKPLLDIEELLEHERDQARKHEWATTLVEYESKASLPV